jgi:hypothetical protein
LLAANVGKFISYFRFPEESEVLPKAEFEKRVVYYSQYQFNEYLEFANARMTDDKIEKYFKLAEKSMNKNGTTDAADQYIADVFDFDSYLDRGRIFGNIYDTNEPVDKILHPKFDGVLQEIAQIKNQDGYRKCAVVYSGFRRYGLDLFENYVTTKDITKTYIIGRLDPRLGKNIV